MGVGGGQQRGLRCPGSLAVAGVVVVVVVELVVRCENCRRGREVNISVKEAGWC